MVFVLDELAVGNYEDAIAPHPRISALLNVAAERDLDSPRATYHKVPMIDMTPIPVEQMKEAVDWIRDQIPSHTVMVFCNSGVGRSPSVVIGYLCCVLGYRFGEAVEFVARKKPDISILPNLIRTIENIKIESAG